MAHKRMGQASFVEAFLRPDVGVNRRLERIDRMIDWTPLERLVKPVRSGAWAGRRIRRWRCSNMDGEVLGSESASRHEEP
jgi:hypothetical protein